jgi:hypothetical protein
MGLRNPGEVKGRVGEGYVAHAVVEQPASVRRRVEPAAVTVEEGIVGLVELPFPPSGERHHRGHVVGFPVELGGDHLHPARRLARRRPAEGGEERGVERAMG